MDHYNRQNLLKMRQEIKDFKANSISISSFLANLAFLFRLLKNTNYSWDELFLKEMVVLESVNSCIPSITIEENVKDFISEEIFNLERLVSDRLHASGIEVSLGIEIILGEDLKKELDRGCDITRISDWAFNLLYIERCDELLPETSSILESLSAMEAGPEFEYTEQELRLFAETLITNGEDSVRKINELN